GSRRRHGRESRAVLLRSGRKHGHSQTPSAGREQSRGTDHSDLGMSSWTDRMPPLGKKRTGFGPHPESEHPGQMRLECRSRTAISCDSHERREQHFRRPAAKSGQGLVRTQKANNTARCGWNADHALPTLLISNLYMSRKTDYRQQKADRFWSAPRKRTPRPDAAGMPIAHSHFL